MIEARSFLGMSLDTRGQRRRLVILYYGLVLAFLVVGSISPHLFALGMIAQTVTLGGLLGGIRMDGPVKRFREPSQFEAEYARGPIGVNLSQRRPFGFLQPLDERDRAERDHAHFQAYRLLCLVMVFVGLGYWMSMNPPWEGLNAAGAWLCRKTPVVLWGLVVLALSLPQSVILWTESAPGPDAD
jgi:hypothetical protein